MSRLSIIIPSPGEPRDFEDTLASVLANRPRDSEILVPMRVPYEDPYDLGGEVGFLFFPEVRSLVELINESLPCAKGDVIHILQPGLEVAENWTDVPLELLQHDRTATVSPVWRVEGREVTGVRLTGTGRRKLVVRTESASAAREPVGAVLACGFHRRRELNVVGGFARNVPASLADVETALRLSVLGFQHVVAEESVVQGAWNAPRCSAWRRGRHEERMVRRRAVSRGKPASGLGKLLTRVGASVVQPGLFGRVAYLAGRVHGAIDRGIESSHAEWLAATQEALEAAAAERRSDAGPRWRRAA